MDIFKRLFGGGSASPQKGTRGGAGDRGIYFFVKPFGCEEIIRVRIDPMNDLSQSEDESAFFVRKVASGVKCFKRVDLELSFDKNRRLIDTQIKGGELVQESDWTAWVQANP